jgi:prepilin-type N-terminal cleavage/methylation domain-containing protein
MPASRSSDQGFTLIELLVVVALMVTMLSIGVASYNSFNQTATLDGAAKALRANLRLAQAFAINGEKIGATCSGTFNGYYVTLSNNATSYQLGQYCSLSNTTQRTPPSPITLPTGATITGLPVSHVTVLFKSVQGADFNNCISATPCFTPQFNGPLNFQVRMGSATRALNISAEGKVQ